MAQGRGSAAHTLCLVLFLLCIMNLNISESATYTVGDSNGWTFTSGGWPRGKRFRAGDVLVFNYNPSIHDVVAVSASAYKSCSIPRGSDSFKSGKDRVTLKRGTNYFVCSVAGHCQGGMKMAVTAV